jgi:hypothetical protein
LKRNETDSPLWVRRQASASCGCYGQYVLFFLECLWPKTHSRRDINSLDTVAQSLLLLVGNSVGDDKLGQLGLVELFYSVAGEDAMGNDGNSAAGSVFDNDFGGLAESTASIGHVVDDDGDLAANISDQNHARDLVGTSALLVDESKAEVEAVGDGSSSLGTASVGGDDDTVLDLEVVADPAEGAGLSVEVVDRDVEEALDLRGVEVHSDDVVAAGGLKHVSHQTGSDGSAGFVLLVLASVGEVGQDGGDATGRGGLASVDHDEQLHDSIVDVAGGSRLQDKDWNAAVSLVRYLPKALGLGVPYHPRREQTRRC